MVSDKEQHGLWEVYQKHFLYLKDEPVNVLEIGVKEGHSVNYMAEKMFVNEKSRVYGIDIKDPSLKLNKKVKFIKTTQTDPALKTRLPKLDIIIDDASHEASLTLRSFELLFDKVKSGGWYVIEDWHPTVLPEMAKVVLTISEQYKEQFEDTILWQKDTVPVAATVLFKKK